MKMAFNDPYQTYFPSFSNDGDLQVFLDKNLTSACEMGDIDQVLDLLQKGASVDGDAWTQSLLLECENYKTPLMEAAMNGHGKIVKLLLENDADKNKGDRYNVTPLHCAALHGHRQCVSLLIRWGANVNATTYDYDRVGVHQKPHRAGTTPLHLAARQNHADCIRELLEEGNAGINQPNVLGLTALNLACQNGYEDCVLALIESRKDVALSSAASQVTADTTLHDCVRHGMVRATRELLKLGMDVNKRNAAGYTPLHFAVIQGQVPRSEMVSVLIENGQGIDVNAAIGDKLAGTRNRAGRKGAGLRALHLVSFSQPPVLHTHEPLTMEFHLSRNFKTSMDPSTPVRDVKTASLLIQYGADTSVCYNGRTILQEEIYNQRDSTLLELLVQTELWVRIPERPVHVSHDEDIRGMRERKIEWLRELAKTPPLLQHFCRIEIRRLLTPLRLNRVGELPVPAKLKEYILLKC